MLISVGVLSMGQVHCFILFRLDCTVYKNKNSLETIAQKK